MILRQAYLCTMRLYPIRMPGWISRFYPDRTWHMDRREKKIYLTFDDGPHPQITAFVLDQLRAYGAKASFFCIGKNVEAYPQIYRQILEEGHTTGNHTMHHLNGWETDTGTYVEDIELAARWMDTSLFRPPYGRIRSAQAKYLAAYRIIMWDVLSGDFDRTIRPERCLENIIRHSRNGSIVVLHDSEKAWERMSYVLPAVLEHFSQKGYEFVALPAKKTAVRV